MGSRLVAGVSRRIYNLKVKFSHIKADVNYKEDRPSRLIKLIHLFREVKTED